MRLEIHRKHNWYPDLFYRCESISKIRRKLDHLRSLLDDPVIFKNMYRYAYDFARVRSKHVKCLLSLLPFPLFLIFSCDGSRSMVPTMQRPFKELLLANSDITVCGTVLLGVLLILHASRRNRITVQIMHKSRNLRLFKHVYSLLAA